MPVNDPGRIDQDGYAVSISLDSRHQGLDRLSVCEIDFVYLCLCVLGDIGVDIVSYSNIGVVSL